MTSPNTRSSKPGRPKLLPEEDYPLQRRAYNILATIKNRCKNKKLDFDLDLEWVLSRIKNKCEVTGLKFVLYTVGQGYGTRHALAPSVDRIDPRKGYTKDNCRVVIWWFNCAKQRYSDIDLWHLCDLVVNSLNIHNVPSVPKREKIEKETT